MVFKKLRILSLLTILFSSFAQAQGEQPPVKPGIYKFTYISMLGNDRGNLSFDAWTKPRKLSFESATFKILNDSTIQRISRRKNVDKYDTTYLSRIASSRAEMFTPLRKSYKDYKLIGAFNFKHMPDDYFFVFYYSAKRNSLMEQMYMFDFNILAGITIYLNQPKNVLTDYKKYFNIKLGEITYNYDLSPKDAIRIGIPKNKALK